METRQKFSNNTPVLIPEIGAVIGKFCTIITITHKKRAVNTEGILNGRKQSGNIDCYTYSPYVFVVCGRGVPKLVHIYVLHTYIH